MTPGPLPFAFDGGGRFYVFDMRKVAIYGEYPALLTDSGALFYAEAEFVVMSFVGDCTSVKETGPQNES